jgi:hypothetical protein
MKITSNSYKNPLTGKVKVLGSSESGRKTHTHICICNHTCTHARGSTRTKHGNIITTQRKINQEQLAVLKKLLLLSLKIFYKTHNTPCHQSLSTA